MTSTDLFIKHAIHMRIFFHANLNNSLTCISFNFLLATGYTRINLNKIWLHQVTFSERAFTDFNVTVSRSAVQFFSHLWPSDWYRYFKKIKASSNLKVICSWKFGLWINLLNYRINLLKYGINLLKYGEKLLINM